MTLLNYTTQKDADKTAGEISEMLRRAGARAVLTEYDEKGDYISSLSFKMLVGGSEIAFRLPCDWRPVQNVLQEQKRRNSRVNPSQEQSIRVAWRIVKDWIEAQLAIIETKMVKTEDVFLPYAIMKDGKTLAESIQSNPEFLLGSGN